MDKGPQAGLNHRPFAGAACTLVLPPMNNNRASGISIGHANGAVLLVERAIAQANPFLLDMQQQRTRRDAGPRPGSQSRSLPPRLSLFTMGSWPTNRRWGPTGMEEEMCRFEIMHTPLPLVHLL